MRDIYSTKLIDLMPEVYQQIDEIQWICAAVQPQLDEVVAIIRDKIIFTNLTKLDDVTLDYLLVECGIANSIETVFIKTREDKIKFITDYVILNKLRGTRAGIEYALGILGVTAEITEWFEDPQELQPFWFKIKIISDKILTDDELRLLRAYVKEYKNTRSWYKTEVEHKYPSEIYAAGYCATRITIESKAEYNPVTPSNIYVNIINQQKITIQGKCDATNI